jgi:hypothetical protein
MKQKKSLDARVKEVVEFRKKFQELGLDPSHPQVKILIDLMNDFARHGYGFSNIVDLSDFGRKAVCKFSTQKNCVSTIILKATP